MQFVEYPVTHDKIVRVVDECLRKNFLCSLGDDMIITFETKQMVPSVCAKRNTTPPCLPKCLAVQPTFVVEDKEAFCGDKLVIVVQDKNCIPSSSSFVGGSESQSIKDSESTRSFSISKWASKLAIAYFTGNKKIWNHIEVVADTNEQLKSSLSSLGDILLKKSIQLPSDPKVQDYLEVLEEEFASINDESDIVLPSGIRLIGSPKVHCKKTKSDDDLEQFTSLHSNSCCDSSVDLLKCRLRMHSDTPILSISAESLSRSNLLLDVMAAEDCGRGKHLKKGTWVSLEKVLVEDKLLLVTPPQGQDSFRIRTQHFSILKSLADDEIDTDDDA
jgi:hypothetical protein